MRLRQTANRKSKTKASRSIFPAISCLPFPVDERIDKNWLFSIVVEYIWDRMLQYDAFHYAGHERIDEGELDAISDYRKPTVCEHCSDECFTPSTDGMEGLISLVHVA